MNVIHLAQAMAIVTIIAAPAAHAADLVKLAIGQHGNWDTAVCHLGTKAGIFKKHDIETDAVYTSGAGETLQPVIGGAVDIGIAIGTQGAIAAFSRGAPVRIISAQATGAADYWYAKTSSSVNRITDLTATNTIAFSTNGSSTQSVVRAFINEFKLKVRSIATGNPSATLTAVMSGQVDVGWAAPPFGLKEMEEGQTRLIAHATDATVVRDQTIRVIVANANVLATRKDAVVRFMKAYRETVAYMYGDDPRVMKDYAELAGIPEAMAKRVRDEFFPQSIIEPGEIHGLEALMTEAVTLKFLPTPLTTAQVTELVQIVK